MAAKLHGHGDLAPVWIKTPTQQEQVASLPGSWEMLLSPGHTAGEPGEKPWMAEGLLSARHPQLQQPDCLAEHVGLGHDDSQRSP
jgi:hypothetical protein